MLLEYHEICEAGTIETSVAIQHSNPLDQKQAINQLPEENSKEVAVALESIDSEKYAEESDNARPELMEKKLPIKSKKMQKIKSDAGSDELQKNIEMHAVNEDEEEGIDINPNKESEPLEEPSPSNVETSMALIEQNNEEFVIDLTEVAEEMPTEPISIEFESQTDKAFEIDLTDTHFELPSLDQNENSLPAEIVIEHDQLEEEKSAHIDLDIETSEEDSVPETSEKDVLEEEHQPVDSENAEKIEDQTDSHDFMSWLSRLKSTNSNSNDESLTVQERIIEKTDYPTLDSKMVELGDISQEVLESKMNLAKDEELDGVLKDSYLVAQIEKKKKLLPESSTSVGEDGSQNGLNIVSETIAILYAQQDNIPKAIEVYRKLIEKFPEKSAFFASQIDKLKK